jgi:hypothetical protein
VQSSDEDEASESEEEDEEPAPKAGTKRKAAPAPAAKRGAAAKKAAAKESEDESAEEGESPECCWSVLFACTERWSCLLRRSHESAPVVCTITLGNTVVDSLLLVSCVGLSFMPLILFPSHLLML